MAEAIVGPLLSKLQEVAVNEAVLLVAVGGEIDKLRDKLMWLQAVVHETDLRSRHDRNRLISVLGSQIREVSFDAEDAVDRFYLRVSLSRKWWRAAVELIVRLPAHIFYRFVLSREIQSMNARLEEIANNKSTYSEVVNTNGNDDHKRWNACRAIPPNRDDWDMECEWPFFSGAHSERKKDLHRKLKNDSGPKWEVITVAGVGGVGKRALLRHAYETKGSFASEQQATNSNGHFDVSVLISFPREIEDSDVVQKIKEILEREWSLYNQQANKQIRCLVVIDSPINTKMWSELKSKLENEPKLQDIKEVNGSTIKLEALKESDKKELSDSEKFFYHIYDPQSWKGQEKEQQNILKNIRKITGGLPLAIVLLARLMTTMDSNKWDAAAKYIINSNEDSKLQTIMSVCIDDLPDELKSCLLYTAGFPENRAIDAHQLVRLWMAEGLLTQHHKLETEQLGQRYLKELIYRGLLQLVRKSAHGDGGCVEQVAIHDQIHLLLRSEAKRTGFMDVHYGGHTPAGSNVRRLSLLEYSNEFDALSNGLGKLRTVVSYYDYCHLKLSLTVEGQGERQMEVAVGNGDAGSSRGAAASNGTTSPTAESARRNCSRDWPFFPTFTGQACCFLRGSKREDGQGQKARRLNIRKILDESPYLRVINLEGINVGEKLPDRIGDMVHLQYLGIRGSKELKRLPSSVGNLHNLQTIDVRETGVTELPESVWKIQTLRHVLGNELVFPASGDDLKLLQTLETVTIKYIYHKWLAASRRGKKIGLRFLHRLHVVGFEESQRQDLEAVLKETKVLESLSLSGVVGKHIPIDLFTGDASRRSRLEHVASLEVDGKLNEAHDLELFNRLTRLVLRSTNIKQDFINVIAQLPDLAELLLHEGSYEDKELNLCTKCTRAFNSLTVLEISCLSKLEKITKPGRRGVIETRFTDMQRKVDVQTCTCDKCRPPAHPSGQAPAAPAQSGPVTEVKDDPRFFPTMIMEAINNGESTKTGIKNYIKNTVGDPVRTQLEQMVQTGDLRSQPHGRYTYYFLGDPKTPDNPSSTPTFREMILEAIKENLSSKTNIELYINKKYGDQVARHLQDMVRSKELEREERGGHTYYSLTKHVSSSSANTSSQEQGGTSSSKGQTVESNRTHQDTSNATSEADEPHVVKAQKTAKAKAQQGTGPRRSTRLRKSAVQLNL